MDALNNIMHINNKNQLSNNRSNYDEKENRKPHMYPDQKNSNTNQQATVSIHI